MTHDPSLRFASFDLGGTPGRVDAAGRFVVFPGSEALLQALREVLGFRIGVITDRPAGMSRARAQALLDGAGLGGLLDPDGLVTRPDAGADKPDARIYRFAADRVGVAVEHCLYIGADEGEVPGARAAGMQVIRVPAPSG